MADIFISYAREDIRWASNLTQALKSYGWTIWWDPEIPSGKEYDEIIEEELSRARCIIVGWSEQSVKSRWVKDEAREAVEQEKIIPILIERVKAPLGFRSIQTINLETWDGTVNSSRLEGLVKELEKTLGPAPNQHVLQDEYRRTQEFFTKLIDYDTGQISAIFRLIRKYNDVVDTILFRANHQACRFYDIVPDSTEASGSGLFLKMSSWMNADDFEALKEDQIRLAQNLILGQECLASIPARFNNQHPHAEFRDQSFMPIISAFSERFITEDHVEELIAITYINLSIICKSL